MAQSDDAREQINKLRDKQWVEKRLDALAPAGDKRRSDLQRALGSFKKNRWELERDTNRRKAAIEFLATLKDVSRPRFFAGLFTHLGPALEQLWHDLALCIYTVDYEPVPFRTPARAEKLLDHRAAYIIRLVDCLRGLDPTPQWIAEHATALLDEYNAIWNDPIGRLLAATLNAGGPDAAEVRHILLDTVAGTHETARFGDHTIVALLNSTNPEDWKAIGNMLLAAQRQEGLRQSILERVDEAHPDAFRYFIGLVLEHDLARFSSVVRTFDVWFATAWAAGSVKPVNEGLTTVAKCLDDQAERERLMTEGTPQECYFALWAAAFLDAEDAMRLGEAVINGSPDPERRFAAWLILDRATLRPELTGLIREHLLAGKETCGHIRMLWAERLAVTEFKAFDAELFDAMGRYYEEMPKKETKPKALLWPWLEFTDEKRTPARALAAIAGPEPMRMLPYAESLDSWECARFMRHLTNRPMPYESMPAKTTNRVLSGEATDFLVRMTVDARKEVHSEAFECLKHKKVPIGKAEVDLLVKNLHRVAATFRKGAIERLATLQPDERLAVAKRLLGDKHAKRRAAGLELCATLIEESAKADEARSLIKVHEDALGDNETKDAAARLVAEAVEEPPAIESCFGLIEPAERAEPVIAQLTGSKVETEAAKACLESLCEFFIQHSDVEIELDGEWIGDASDRVRRIGEAGYGFPRLMAEGAPDQQARARLPIYPKLRAWVDDPERPRDPDGLELVRAACWGSRDEIEFQPQWKTLKRKLTGWGSVGFSRMLIWAAALAEPRHAGRFLVAYIEDRMAGGAPEPHEALADKGDRRWSAHTPGSRRPIVLNEYPNAAAYWMTPEDWARFAALEMAAIPQGHSGPDLVPFVHAFDAGLLTVADFVYLLVGPRYGTDGKPKIDRYGPLEEVMRLKHHQLVAERPALVEATIRVRDKIIDIELLRGERPGPTTELARDIHHAGGTQTLLRLVAALGKDKLHRGGFYFYHEQPTRPASLSRLISVTAPSENDTPEAFTRLYKQHNITPARLLEIAIYAPQWARHAEHALAMPGLEDAAWWIHAHTKQSDYFRDQEFREIWNAQIHERTSLTGDDLLDGAVDVAWFHDTYKTLGPKNWQAVQKAAKYASSSGGHKRAELFAQAMLGQVKPAELEARIDKNRHQDSLRALGLVPLPPKTAKAETLRRYNLMQEYKRQSRQFGSQRQASEGRAVDIAMHNLARTAGYKDPARLQWAMEAQAVADLAKDPVSENHEETTVTLAIDDAGAPELTIVKAGKPIKAIPAKLRKHKPFAELKGRVAELRRQASRMRLSLEEAMCRGDTFTGAELAELLAHPILRPMLERLVFIGDKTNLIGYPEKAGKLLRSHDTNIEPIGKADTLRLAHPLDLLERGDWPAWQRDCFQAERVQPFKQICTRRRKPN